MPKRPVAPEQRDGHQEHRRGGYGGYFADPDGCLWKVVAAAGEQPFAE